MTWRLRSGETLALTGVGAVSSVGGTAVETAAAVRAGICRFEEATFYRPLTDDPEWDKPEPLIAAAVPSLPVSIRGADRIRELGACALRDLLRTMTVRRANLGRAGLFLALPEPDEVARGWMPGPALGAVLCEQLRLSPCPSWRRAPRGARGRWRSSTTPDQRWPSELSSSRSCWESTASSIAIACGSSTASVASRAGG